MEQPKFTVTYTIIPASAEVSINGIMQLIGAGNSYTKNNNSINFTWIPRSVDAISVKYRR